MRLTQLKIWLLIPISDRIIGSIFQEDSSFLVRIEVVRPQVLSVFHSYQLAGLKKLSVKVQNALNSSFYEKKLSEKILVLDKVGNLSMQTRFCALNMPCNLTALLNSGSEVSFLWTLEGSTINTTNFSVFHVFKSIGTAHVELIARNVISSKSVSKSLVIIDL
jgi:hypothetical protein